VEVLQADKKALQAELADLRHRLAAAESASLDIDVLRRPIDNRIAALKKQLRELQVRVRRFV
jgi:hypothetical protein